MVGFVHPVLNRTYIKQTTNQQDKLHRFIVLLDLNSPSCGETSVDEKQDVSVGIYTHLSN